MNIHIKDINLFNKLKESAILKIEIGSSNYKLNTSNSDVDYLYIYPTTDNELNSFVKVHHQFQYKEDNIDHNFVNLHTFIGNLINGDSTINYEVVNNKELINSNLEFLYKMKDSFRNYSIIRSYLGMARRDLKMIGNELEEVKNKKLIHAIRGYFFAKSIMENNFNLINDELILIANDIRTRNFKQNWSIVEEYNKKISSLREELNLNIQNKSLILPKLIEPKNAKLLDDKIFNLIKSENWLNKKIKNFDLSYYYDTFENWVVY
jgi:predicted nucleotidyltransferase